MNDPPRLAGGQRKWRRNMVREERLELSRIAPLDPKSSAYASFATLAQKIHTLQGDEFNTASRCRQEDERPPEVIGALFSRPGEPASDGPGADIPSRRQACAVVPPVHHHREFQGMGNAGRFLLTT